MVSDEAVVKLAPPHFSEFIIFYHLLLGATTSPVHPARVWTSLRSNRG
jgi:hypothetical protein